MTTEVPNDLGLLWYGGLNINRGSNADDVVKVTEQVGSARVQWFGQQVQFDCQ